MPLRGVIRTLQNIYDGAFCKKAVNLLRENVILDIWHGSKNAYG